MTTLLCAAGVLILSPALVQAAQEGTGYSAAALQMIWALLLVVGIILVLYAVAKKRFSPGGSGSGIIEVKEIRYLMPKKGLAVVQVRGREYLLGIGTDRIELLTPLAQEQPTEQNSTDSFADLLAKQSR